MQGIAGLIDYSKQQNSDYLHEVIKNMTQSFTNHGSAVAGTWIDAACGIAFGGQPATSRSGRFVTIFNGKIYNCKELRAELHGIGNIFHDNSDAEVILSAIEAWGIEKAVTQFVGMFAIAIWDKQEQILCLCRDRIGEKPLYYGWVGNVFMFASELKAFRSYPDFKGEINIDALPLYINHGYFPSPHTVYRNFYKLNPGHILTLKNNTEMSFNAYWSAEKMALSGTQNLFKGSFEEADLELENLLKKSIKNQMISDVPIGAFLSGGIDSSMIVALMQSQSSIPVKTFSIGFYEEEFNEAGYAKKIAEYLGTEHTEMYITPDDAIKVIPLLPSIYDEPFADSSQIPTYLAAKLARSKVEVILSGDAGDELFGGYVRYIIYYKIWNKIMNTPYLLRKLCALGITILKPDTWNSSISIFNSILPSRFKPLTTYKIYKLRNIIMSENVKDFYQKYLSHNGNSLLVGVDGKVNLPGIFNIATEPFFVDAREVMMYLDLITYLPDDCLVKVERACRAAELESRVPLLDHRIVEFAWRLPLNMKLDSQTSKKILREIVYRYIPKELLERPKQGFGVPVGTWLCEELRPWAEELLAENRLKQEGYFRADIVRKKWQEHLSGKVNNQALLWTILMFQAWLESK